MIKQIKEKPFKDIFQGEKNYIANYYDLIQSGSYDDYYLECGNYPVYIFNLTDEDFNLYPDLIGFSTLEIRINNRGFVYSDLEI